MNRIFTLTVACLLCALSSQAVLKTWIGASGGSWSVGTNWSGGTAPLSADDVQFTGPALVTMDVSPNINSILVSAAGQVELSASAARTITLSSTSAITPGLKINAGATLKLSQSAASAFALALTGTAGVTGQIYGTLQFTGTNASASARLDLFAGAVANGTVTVFDGGIIQYDINTGNTIGNGLTGLIMEAGSQYIVNRNGGTMPAGNFKNGSYIRINGVTTNLFSFNTTANYNGVIEWNCTGQTLNGSSAGLGLSSSYPTIDSFVVKNTGATGTLRFATEMTTSPTFNYIRVEGGTLEVASPRAANRTMTVNNDITVIGGTLYVNATDGTDNLTSYNMTLNVNGNVSVTGGTLNMSNRPNGSSSTYGTGNINVKGNFLQTGGLITETAPVPPISDASSITMSGTVAQNLALTNWTNQIRLLVNNTGGVNLQSNVSCPDFFIMSTAGAYVVLGNYHFTTTYNQSSINVAGTNPARLVTNGTGHYTITNVASAATVTFPVTPVVNSISSVILKNNDIFANTFDVRVERGNNPSGIFNTGLTVNRTWIINDLNTPSSSNAVELTFLYPDTVLNGGAATRGNTKELGHFVGTVWNVDPVGTALTPSQGGASPATDTTGPFAPNTLDSAFVLGNQFSILNLASGITLNYFKGNKRGSENMLNWAVNCTSNQAKFEIQRSGNGISFTTIANITASFNRCLQPFDFTDNNPLAGLNYYRIKIIDIDGTVTYSTFVLLQNKACAPGGMAMVPTLVNKPAAVICLDATAATALQFVVTDVNGRPVQTVKETAATGQNQFTINLEKLAPGLYYLSAYGSNQKWTTVRFVKL
jgi:fibronectin-binding autotransporter adhesin